ncbi:MAG: excinuclease ABC subunit UvrC [Clostridia bacterium]|nr:excinuclease ABC subunit UvrC [Clostridia bacterium]
MTDAGQARRPLNGARVSPELEFKIANLPDSPGCYLMKSEGKIIYVGKAVNLKNRVSQYFRYSAQHTAKVRAMVEKIDDFDIVLVNTELEAFALECNLIKLHMPFYNILLKDDKAYPYIRVDLQEDFPLVDLARRQEKDGAKYFGPYQGATVVREVLDVVRMVFPIRVCRYAIHPDKPRRPCIHHQVGQCPAPCAGLISREDYQATIDRALEFLGGRYAPVLEDLKQRMMEASVGMNYERAALYRDRMRAVESIMEKQQAISTVPSDQDVIAVLPREADALIQLMFIRSGRMIGSERFTLEGAGDEPLGEILTQFMLQYYGPENTPPREILLSATLPEQAVVEQLLTEQHGARTYLLVPRRGEKLRLVNMALKNLKDTAKRLDRRDANSHARTIGALEELQSALGLDTLPRRIEGYDISNTQGALSVASEVVMVDGVSANKEYRRYRIKTVEGANDFASMYEVITRRLSHGLDELAQRREQGLDPQGGKFSWLPDLILVDGGRGQLTAAREAMLAQGLNIPMIGLAKRIEEIVLPDEEESLLLDRHSPALHLLQRVRDESHRFAIIHHRTLRGKASIASRLDGIPGVGEKRKKAILKHFKTVEALMAADEAAMKAVPGLPEGVAGAVVRFLHGDAASATGEAPAE